MIYGLYFYCAVRIAPNNLSLTAVGAVCAQCQDIKYDCKLQSHEEVARYIGLPDRYRYCQEIRTLPSHACACVQNINASSAELEWAYKKTKLTYSQQNYNILQKFSKTQNLKLYQQALDLQKLEWDASVYGKYSFQQFVSTIFEWTFSKNTIIISRRSAQDARITSSQRTL